MAILSNINILSKSLWIIIAITVSLYSQKVAAAIDDESYSSDSDFGEIEKSLTNELDESSDINSTESEHVQLPMDFSRLCKRSIQQTFKNSPNSMFKEEIRFPRVDETIKEKAALTLPGRFAYVARQFYRYVWERRNNPRNDIRETVDSEKNTGRPQESKDDAWADADPDADGNDDDDNDEEEPDVPTVVFTTTSPSDYPKGPYISGRNIIDAPSSGCPPGQRKDRNGRCRKTLW